MKDFEFSDGVIQFYLPSSFYFCSISNKKFYVRYLKHRIHDLKEYRIYKIYINYFFVFFILLFVITPLLPKLKELVTVLSIFGAGILLIFKEVILNMYGFFYLIIRRPFCYRR
jgi:small-conductance mechanosensitive channel